MASNKLTWVECSHACRSRKVRCDGKQPTCSRCTHAHRECSFVKHREFSFRHSTLSSRVAEEARDQLSLATESGHGRSSPDQCSEPVFEGHASPVAFVDTPGPFSPLVRTSSRSSECQYHNHYTPDAQFLTPASIILPVNLPTPTAPSTNVSVQAISTTEYGHARWPDPLTGLEGELLQFFVCNIGPWLDVTSPERHYTYTVPVLALKSHVLFYAVMACAAHVLRLLSKNRRPELGEEEANYQNKCLEILIPLLNNQDAAFQDEFVLATIAILRMSEQYEEFHVDRQFHLVPQAFDHFRAKGPSSTTLGGLREATFYSFVRADIRMAILGKCGTRLEMDKWPLDTTLINDADWANQMTYFLVQAINLCMSPGAPGILPKDTLLQKIDAWRSGLPDSFEPYYYREPDHNEPFPVVRLLCPWHAVGFQFYHAAKILLGTTFFHENDGFTDMLQYNTHIAANVLPHARMLCGISLSNEHHGCRINASHLLALGAQFFNGRQEQTRVLNYFYKLEDESAWPSRECRKMLEDAYGVSQ